MTGWGHERPIRSDWPCDQCPLRSVCETRGVLPQTCGAPLTLPVIDGWEVTRRLKADPRTAAIPVIALTAHAMEGDRERALAAGCDEFDTKPIDFDRLLGKLHVVAKPPPDQSST